PTLRRAAEAFRATAGRRGHVVTLADAADVCVAGDMHGNVDNFARLLRVADLARHPPRHPVVQAGIHRNGHHPRGSRKSHQLLALVAALACQFPGRAHFLPGNHELSQWTDRQIGKGDEDLNELFRRGVVFAYGDHAAAVYDAYMDLIAAAPLALRTPNR